jgi:hypothetical protein
MTLAKKGSRRIVVDGRAFRWKIRARPTYTQALGAPLVVAIERDVAHRAAKLIVHWTAARPDAWLGESPRAVVTPRDVERAIRRAVRDGWDAEAASAAFELRDFD